MHTTAMKYGREFFEKYGAPGWTVVEIGSQEVEGQGQREGALRQAARSEEHRLNSSHCTLSRMPSSA